MTFTPLDPLESKTTRVSDAALGALKREIKNILSSYVGWYDPFCELIQNALDAVEARAVQELSAGNSENYKPKIDIIIDLDDNSLTVSDNGIGLDKEKFEQFLAPNFSFKNGATRGHKGVGATYVAYGFNYMRVSTRVPGFQASGRIIGARRWLNTDGLVANPKVEPDDSAQLDSAFDSTDRGVSISVRFDETTHPKRLDWIQADTAEKWGKILSIKTGLGSIVEDDSVEISIQVKAKAKLTEIKTRGTRYLWLHKSAAKTGRIRDLEAAAEAIFKKHGIGRRLPDKYRNLDFVYDSWSADELANLLAGSLDAEEIEILKRYKPTVSVEFGFSAKLWTSFNEGLKLRPAYKVLTAGIQMAANNMPQGEVMLIPLQRNIGRQHQIHFLIHFENYSPDLGRKGFHRELSDFAKSVSKTIADDHLAKLRTYLKANTGVSPDLVRELKIGEWKREMLDHEKAKPLSLTSEHFFKPSERVSITSAPTREQDVIALFNQLVAGGVIRGISVMSTNERFTYDGLFKIAFDLPVELYVYSAVDNPLGVPASVATALQGQVTEPRILEYKFSLDGLVEDIDSISKNINDVYLCVVWETGQMYSEKYGITSLLMPENADQRQYHGVTHILTDIETGARNCELIVLSELIESLNDQDSTADRQREKYE
ncbi:MAG TPA: hypothetical protein VGO06_19610 [Bosea sp. (in: a-proteobacteria)]|jgi:hypothetical protein|uniref:hypothetical protein n=1 Tax=Bosea sp. (in: a-proteobacteria) TaxID=1871050 RepID=UPI002E0D179B|nr:hypothetical protein [Bosea sp. (in: a-proteobacteria)]